MPYLLSTIEVNNAQFNVIVTKRSCSKAIILRFNQSKSELHISAPVRVKRADIEKFVRSERPKIEAFLKRNIITKIKLCEGLVVPILGVKHRLMRPQNAVNVDFSQKDFSVHCFSVHCGGKPFEIAASTQLQRVMHHYASQKITQIMNMPPLNGLQIVPHLTLRKTRSRYGSCCPKTGRIMLCSNLVFAPISVLDSVIFHEAAHLIHANHSAEFWALVAHLNPDYATAKLWLKRNSADIFTYTL